MTSTDAPVPADLYLRLSDARNEEALDGREARLRARAAELGWAIHRVVIENDMVPGNGDGKLRPASAWKRRRITTPSGRVELRTIRPGFRLILDDLATGRVQAVLAEDLDRMLRQPRDNEDLLDQVELSRATCRSLTGSLALTDGGTADEQFIARTMANVANKSSADTARRVAAARKRLAGQSYQGGRRPYGYQPKPRTEKYHRNLVQRPEEAAVIRQAATDILDLGISLKAIARDLRERGVPTVTGTAWSAETLKDVLIKPAVAGLAVAKDDDGARLLVPAPWHQDRILDGDVWERLRDKLTDLARRTNQARANEPRWLVSGFATCGVCGGPIRAAGGRDRAPAYVGNGCCHVRRTAARVDDAISQLVTDRLDEPDAAGLLRPPPRPQVDAGKLRAKARDLRRRRQAQRRMHADGLLDDAELADSLRDFAAKLARIDVQLAASDHADPLPEFRDGRPAETVWAGLGMARRRAVVQTLLEWVKINRAGRRGRGFDPNTLQIKWRPEAAPSKNGAKTAP
jgi:DNA invertase Pin-like site-specific DNA recombinase